MMMMEEGPQTVPAPLALDTEPTPTPRSSSPIPDITSIARGASSATAAGSPQETSAHAPPPSASLPAASTAPELGIPSPITDEASASLSMASPIPPNPAISQPAPTPVAETAPPMAPMEVLLAPSPTTSQPAVPIPHPQLNMYPADSLPASTPSGAPATMAGPGGNLPVCQNCQTSTTPLWRRDEMGAVLCNACGLFLKLHGRARPISLKTDVIKSRNRVKTARTDMNKQKPYAKKQAVPAGPDANGADMSHLSKSANGHTDNLNSPISRTGTPAMYNPHGLPHMYNGMDGAQFQPQPPLPGFAASPSGDQSLNSESLDMPTLVQSNASLKTRVSELEVIQELYRSRLQELEAELQQYRHQSSESEKQEVAQLRLQLDSVADCQSHLQKELEESHRRENTMKRRLDELEQELENGHTKRPRLEDSVAAAAAAALSTAHSAIAELDVQPDQDSSASVVPAPSEPAS